MKSDLWRCRLFRFSLALLSCVGTGGMALPVTADEVRLPDTPIRIHDGGSPRAFAVARDELFVRNAVERVSTPPATPSDMRAYVRARGEALREPAALILYEVGVPQTESTRRILTKDVVVALPPDTDPDALAKAVGARSVRLPPYAKGYAIFSADDAAGASLSLAERLREQPGVRFAEPELKRLRFKRYTPNDPLFSAQWHLLNTGQGGGTVGMDVRVTNVWAQGFFGAGVRIGIVDDGLQYTHPDLSPNYDAAYSRNWNGSPGGLYDPAPNTGGPLPDNHGTPCAGVAAARGNNSTGVSGAAPQALLSGLRLISGVVGDSEEAEAMAYSNQHLHVKSNSWGPYDDGRTLEAPGPLMRAALSNSVVSGRGGLGTIHVWAGGNGLDVKDDSNYDGYANSIYTIAIAAVDNVGLQSWYSEPGANLVVTAPSDGGSLGIVTTDLLGKGDYPGNSDYTESFGGTSSATPLVAGITALMLEANPALGWRDVQEILLRTARLINPGDADWRTNSFGYTFNHKFGSGLVDADAAVTTAATWTNLAPARMAVTNQSGLALAIPDNSSGGVSTTFNVSTNLRVEQVTVMVNITHARRAHLNITLTSPSGMESRLATQRSGFNADYSDWVFMSVRHWGEESAGTWTLHVSDTVSGTAGTLNSVQLMMHGTDGGEPPTDVPPALSSIGDRAGLTNNLLSFTVTAADVIDNDLITLTASNLPPWATFATTAAVSTVSQTFAGTPPDAGTWETTFHAYDKDGYASETVTLTITGYVGSNYVVALNESFDAGQPPGWTVVTTNGSADAYWRFDDPGDRGNLTGGAGLFAMADSDHAGHVPLDSSLHTPPLNMLTWSHVTLAFKTDFRFYPPTNEVADVDVSVSGMDGPWVNVWRKTLNYRGPKTEEIDLSGIAAGQTNVLIRFRFYDANYDYWWQVDDVMVYGYEVDSDGDGMPDAWEEHYFGNLTTAGPGTDYTDNDFSDLEAFWAGTDPTDPHAALQVEHQAMEADGVLRIQWQSAADRYYRIARSTNLPSFVPIAAGIPATPPLNTYDDDTATNAPVYIYRIELDAAP